ncbi:MAG TPA: hypothetical protein ENH82_14070 [bacterium]|nr:hypothetical protein [bacterium]
MAKRKTMQESITTTILQVGKWMKKRTIEYIIYHYRSTEAHPEAEWKEYRQHFSFKQMAIDEINESKSFKTRMPDDHYKLIKRTTTEEEIDLT